jgi:hypothetical protein
LPDIVPTEVRLPSTGDAGNIAAVRGAEGLGGGDVLRPIGRNTFPGGGDVYSLNPGAPDDFSGTIDSNAAAPRVLIHPFDFAPSFPYYRPNRL